MYTISSKMVICDEITADAALVAWADSHRMLVGSVIGVHHQFEVKA